MGVGEWYHCYTRGVDKRKTFDTKADYQRFIQILYLANNTEAVHRSNLGSSHESVFAHERGELLVSVAAYCIMPNHFHLVMQETREGGIAKFMQKVGTSYAMYFNIKNERVGNLFVKPFRSKHLVTDGHWLHIAQYLHLNPLEIFARGWRDGKVRYSRALENKLVTYQYSSLPDYLNVNRPEKAVLDPQARDLFADGMPRLRETMEDAAEYYRELTI